jgi:hypothetical protein
MGSRVDSLKQRLKAAPASLKFRAVVYTAEGGGQSTRGSSARGGGLEALSKKVLESYFQTRRPRVYRQPLSDELATALQENPRKELFSAEINETLSAIPKESDLDLSPSLEQKDKQPLS